MNKKQTFFYIFLINAFLFSTASHSMDITINEQEGVVVRDWSKSVIKQTDNTCGFNAVYNASKLFNNCQQDTSAVSKELADQSEFSLLLEQWQEDVQYNIDLRGDHLRYLATDKVVIPEDHITVIDSYSMLKDGLSEGRLGLSDNDPANLYHAILRLRSTTPGVPHVFFLGTMQYQSAGRIGHWVTCVARRNENHQLQIDYADSMNPDINIDNFDSKISRNDLLAILQDDPTYQTQTKSNQDNAIKNILNEHTATARQAIEQRKDKITKFIQDLILKKEPINLLMASPLANSLDSYDTVRDENGKLRHLHEAIRYIFEWNLLNIDDFHRTNYPQRILERINTLFNADFPAAQLTGIATKIHDFQDDTGIDEARFLLSSDETLNQYLRPDPIEDDNIDALNLVMDADEYEALGNEDRRPVPKSLNEIKTSWFQSLKSYITPKNVILTGLCAAAGIWLLNKAITTK